VSRLRLSHGRALLGLAVACGACGAATAPTATPPTLESGASAASTLAKRAPRFVRAIRWYAAPPHSARWSPSGEVVVQSALGLLRFRPDDAAPSGDVVARVLAWPPERRGSHDVASVADVFAVETERGLQVSRDGGPWVLHPNVPGGALSADGRWLVVSSGLSPTTNAVYDLTTDKPIFEANGHSARLSPSGGMLMTSLGLFDVKSGRTLMPRTNGKGAFLGTRAVSFDALGLAVFDEASGKLTRVDATCPRDEGFASADSIDAIARRAVRPCRRSVFVVDLDAMSVVTMQVPSLGEPRWLEVRYSRDDPRVVLEADGTYVVVDPVRRTAKSESAIPFALRGETDPHIERTGEPNRCKLRGSEVASFGRCSARLSPDGKSVIVEEPRAGITVFDAATFDVRARLGADESAEASGTSDVRVREVPNGIEVFETRTLYRPPEARYVIGPGALAAAPWPNMAGCASTAFPRVLQGDGRSVAVDASDICECANGTCVTRQTLANTDPSLRPRFVDVGESGIVALTHDYTTTNVVMLERDGKTVRSAPLGSCLDAKLADDGERVIAVCIDSVLKVGVTEPMFLVELSLPTLLVTARRAIAAKTEGTGQPSILVGSKRVAVFDTHGSGGHHDFVHGRVFDRADGVEVAELDVWRSYAVATFPDGKIELFGRQPPPDSHFGCVFDDATVTPFAACRDRVLTKGRFRLE
jgi:hypothetical protein